MEPGDLIKNQEHERMASVAALRGAGLEKAILVKDEENPSYKVAIRELDRHVASVSTGRLVAECDGINPNIHPSNLVSLFEKYAKENNLKNETSIKLIIVLDQLNRLGYVLKNVDTSSVRLMLQFCIDTGAEDLLKTLFEILRKQPDFDLFSTLESIVVSAKDYKEVQELMKKGILTRYELDSLVKIYYNKNRKDPGGCYTKIQQALKFIVL